MASPSQEIVLTSSPGGTITAYDASSGASLAKFSGSRLPCKGLAVAGGKLVAASHASEDTGMGSIHLYNWWSPTAFQHLTVPEPVAPLTATPDGLHLFAGGLSGHIHALSLPSGNLTHSVAAHSKPISCLEINGDGSLLFSGSDDGTIAVLQIYKLIDISPIENSSISVLHRFIGHDSSVTAITTGMGGFNSTIISCSLDCTCKFWSLMLGSPLRTVTLPCTVLGVALDPLESKFYIAGSDGLVYNGALKVASRQQLKQGLGLVTWEQKHGGPVISMTMVNGGQNLITASEDGSVWIWEVESGKVINVVTEKTGSISEMVVAKGLGDGGENAEISEFSEWGGMGFSGRELSRPVSEVMKMEKLLNVAINDRSRCIDTFVSTLEIYDQLLELIIREGDDEDITAVAMKSRIKNDE